MERTRETSSRLRSSARQQARIDAIVAERLARLEPIAGAEPASEPSSTLSSLGSVEAAAPVAAPPTEAQSQAMVQALRMAELLAHAAAIGPSAMAPSAGPRMALPSGLGGLVAGMNTVSVIERERAAAVEQAPRRQGALPFTFGFQPIYTAPAAPAAAADSSTAAPSQLASVGDDVAAAPAPVFGSPSWTRAPRALVPEAMRVDSALGSIASRTPAALGHVAWADRWLGRFAGASETALESMSSISMRAQYAPSQLFVAPSLDVPRQVSETGQLTSAMAAPSLDVVAPRRQEASRVEAAPSSLAAPIAAQAPAPRVEAARPTAAPQEALRFGDDDVVPDELFAAIAAGPISRPPQRPAAAVTRAPSAPTAASVAAQTSAPRSAAPQLTAADIVALTAPSAPVDAGLSASLAASPMAPALGHVLSLPRAAVFDPRSLGGSELAFAFLSGAVTAPMVAQFSYGSSAAGSVGSTSGWEPSLAASGEGPSLWRQWSAELVRPAELSRAAAMRGDDAEEVISSTPRPAPAFTAPSAQPVASGAVAAPGTPASTPAVAAAEAAAAAASVENIITLRSTLLSPASPRQQRLAASSGTVASWANQEAVDALPVAYQTLGELLSEAAPDRRWLSTLPAGLSAEGTPLLGDEGEVQRSVRFDHGFPLVFWPLASAPGALGAAMAASAAQEAEVARATRPTSAAPSARAPWAPAWAAAPDAEILAPSASTLVEQGMPGSMDRGALSPGMLAQRALGFGATQSSQTADLSFDFVPPELVLAARVYGFGATEAAQAARLAMGGSTGLSAMAGAVDLRFISLMGPAMGAGAGRQDAAPSTGEPSARAPEAQAAREADASFGVAKRMPRGAFLLPSASVAAMGLSAALPEGEHAMSIAALEVLAAKMVAELGSFASPSMQAMAAGAAGSGAESAAPSRRAPSSTFVDISQPAAATEASEEDVLSSASASIAASRRIRFEQLYIALAESNTGRTMSPAARAARALALANRDEDATTFSSRERAALAWQIFPVVLNGEAAPVAASDDGRESVDGRGASSSSRSRSAPALTTVAPAGDRPGAEMRPGLASLSSRAGEALSSFVTSAPASSGAAASSSSSGGESRGWKSGRFGGGEVEIPSWFEAAARKMFEERGEIEGISLAELTLVAATPPAQIAASTRGETPASVTQKPDAPGAKGEQGQKVDIERVAGEVYRAVMQMMESARMRNGEPYL